MKPRKRILKKPHGPRRNKTSNRVRWNIPEEGSGGGDSVSLLSFESTSTTSFGFSYQQARKSVNESRRNWREFEEMPPPGSTGLTPSKPSLSTVRENCVDLAHTDESSHPPPCSLLTQQESQSASHLSLSRSHPQQHGMGTSNVGMRNGSIESSPAIMSPLSYTTHKESPTEHHHTSTPLRLQHENNPSRQVDIDSAHSSVAPPLAVPILKLDHSNLSDLEASTLEDRVKSNIFEIPLSTANGNSRDPRGPTSSKNSTSVAYSGYIPPDGMGHLCGDSDADDYDHLSPHNQTARKTSQTLAVAKRNIVRFDFFPRPSQTKTHQTKEHFNSSTLASFSGGPPNMGNNEIYRNSDIDEALNGLPDSASSCSGSSNTQSPVPNQSAPFTTGGGNNHQYLPPRGDDNDANVPPPIPPKLRRRKSASPPTMLTNVHRSSVSPSSYSSSGTSEGGSDLSTPSNHRRLPEFAMALATVVQCSNLSQEEAYEDALSSISTATLVPSEPGEPISPLLVRSTQHITAPRVAPKQQHTKLNQSNQFVNNIGSKPSKRMMPAGVRVHPETLHHSSSVPSHQSWNQQWNDNGTKFFTHKPTPTMHHRHQQQPQPSSTATAYTHESLLPPIDEYHNPEKRPTIFSVSTSGSDSSLRAVSPPDKISQASIIQTRPHMQSYYHDNTSSLSQPISIRPQFQPPRGQNFNPNSGSSNRGYPQVTRNPPSMGGSGISRNHRLYHSHRSGLAPRRSNFVQVARPMDDITAMKRTHSPPFRSRALSQDDEPLESNFSLPAGLIGGQKAALRPWIHSTDVKRSSNRHLSQTHTRTQNHTHHGHHTQTNNTRTMTAV